MIEWIGRRIDLLGGRSHPTAATHQLSWQTRNRDRVRAFVRACTYTIIQGVVHLLYRGGRERGYVVLPECSHVLDACNLSGGISTIPYGRTGKANSSTNVP